MGDDDKLENNQAEFGDGSDHDYGYPDPTMSLENKPYYLENTPWRPEFFVNNPQASTSYEHASPQPAAALNTTQVSITEPATKKPKPEASKAKPKHGADALRITNDIQEQWCNGCRKWKLFAEFPTEDGVEGALLLKSCFYCIARARRSKGMQGGK